MLFPDDDEVIFKSFKVQFRHALELFARGAGIKVRDQDSVLE